MCTRLLLASLALAATPFAQDAMHLRGVGVFEEGGALLGVGPRYRARFDPGRFELVPAFGRTVPEVSSLAFELVSIGRANGPAHVARAVDAQPEGRLVRFDHGVAVERYELERRGVEQSFVFPAPLEGTGDLVVRGRIDTPLRRPADGPYVDGVRFVLDGVGGIDWGGVTGIDARGATVRGTLRVDGEHLELVLPAAFVDAAAYPLVLDPLIGPVFDVGVATEDYASPDVAWDEASQLYCVAWQTTYSASSSWVVAQQLNDEGKAVSDAQVVGSTERNERPTVANVVASGRFLIAWQQSGSPFGPWQLHARALLAGTLAKSSEVSLGLAGSNLHPDVGGEARPGEDRCLLVWERANDGVFAQAVDVPAVGDPSLLGSEQQLSGIAGGVQPAVSKSGGLFGRYVVAFEAPVYPDEHKLQYVLVDDDGVAMSPLDQVPSGADLRDIDVDGDGTDFFLVWEHEATPASGSREIHGLGLHWTGGSHGFEVYGEHVLATGADLLDPAVALVEGHAQVLWSRRNTGFQYDVLYQAFDPWTATTCEAAIEVYKGGLNLESTIASQSSGALSGAGTESMAVWTSYDPDPPFDGALKAQVLDAIGTDGTVLEVAPGCGGGGTCVPSPFGGAPNIGNGAFALHLEGADIAASTGLFNLTVPGTPILCGPCDVAVPMFLSAHPASNGQAQRPFPIPCDSTLIGATVEVQWLVLPTLFTPCPAFPTVSASSRLALTIGG